MCHRVLPSRFPSESPLRKKIVPRRKRITQRNSPCTKHRSLFKTQHTCAESAAHHARSPSRARAKAERMRFSEKEMILRWLNFGAENFERLADERVALEFLHRVEFHLRRRLCDRRDDDAVADL